MRLVSNKKTLLGSWITLAHPAIAEIMCNAGFDWLAVDLEHSVITIREAEELIRVISLSGVKPLVRLTWNDANLIKRVMDAGAHGIIIPMINSAEQAKAAVDAVYYPPFGKRGVGLARAQGYGKNFKEYKKWLDQREPWVIVQIEHIEAVKNIDAILAVEGVDGYIVGPYDLSASMGFPGEFDREDVKAAIVKVHAVAKSMGVPGGIHIVEPDLVKLKECVAEGCEFIAYSVDIRMLDIACRAGVESLKEV